MICERNIYGNTMLPISCCCCCCCGNGGGGGESGGDSMTKLLALPDLKYQMALSFVLRNLTQIWQKSLNLDKWKREKRRTIGSTLRIRKLDEPVNLNILLFCESTFEILLLNQNTF